MADETQKILIESVLGGHSPSTHFSAPDQFLSSLGIDPSSFSFAQNGNYAPSSGLLRPMPSVSISPGTITASPLWIKGNPRTSLFYVYSANGSVYTLNSSIDTISALGDLTDGGDSHGNGAAYYDNYMYFSRDTTVARYGPLDGSPTFTDDYWASTLGKTALIQTSYPSFGVASSTLRLPNHVLHRHSDGKLYIADIVGNQGTIHYIKTKKTTVEGDTDDGSTYNKVSVGYGLWPTAMESYGTNLVIAFIESKSGGSSISDTRTNAKLAFWDTVSQNVNQITWVEFPDTIISSLKNINGVLYVASGPGDGSKGFRLSKYIGGSSFEDVFINEQGFPPGPGGMDGYANVLFFGSVSADPRNYGGVGSVFSYGLKKKEFGQGVFNVHRITQGNLGFVSSLALSRSEDISRDFLAVGWADTNASTFGIDGRGDFSSTSGYGNSTNEWFSQIYKIGQPFKIKSIRIPLGQALTANMIVIPWIWTDGLTASKQLTTINSTNYGTTRKSIVIRPENLTGDNDFLLELQWTGTEMCMVSLPITIEYEPLHVTSTLAS